MKTPKLDNRGSGLVTMLVCVMFLVALGVSLLFVSYTGAAVRAVERSSERNFYDAESAMELVRLKVQDTVALALGSAWEGTLTHYSETVAGMSQAAMEPALQDDFTARFKAALQASDLFIDTTLLSEPLGAGNATLSCDRVFWSDTNPVAELQGLTLTYKDGGYEDVITTDIAIYAPPFSYEPTPTVTGVSPTALVAYGGLIVNGDRQLNGNAYASSVYVNGRLTCDKGKLVTGGTLSIGANARLTGNTDAELWCRDINLGEKATFTTTGSADVYCYGDLSFVGDEAVATLSGTYTGFGYTNALYGDNVSANNSSIIISGRDSSLDMRDLNSLVLAGSAYISNTTGSTDVLMGQSIATRSDQLVYLVPEDHLEGIMDSNPCILPEGTSSLTDEQLDDIGDALAASLPLYHITGVEPVYSVLVSHDVMVYLFIHFATQADANLYFKNFYGYYSDYAALYLKKCIAAKSTIAAGNTYTRNLNEYIYLDPNNDTGGVNGVKAQCLALGNSWQNLCRTLTENGTTTSANIYNYYVNSTKLAELSTGVTLFEKNGDTIGCISRGNCEVPACFGSASGAGRLLICDGNVTVSGAFKGLIIASGTVTLNGSGSIAASDDTAFALLARNAADDSLITYLNGGDAALSSSGGTDNGGSWDMSSLVSYVNWKKN